MAAILIRGLPVLVLLSILSLAIGSRAIPLAELWQAFVAFDAGHDLHLILHELRAPRTLLGLCAGAALGLAGGVMQAVTRNPLAEPGLLGVNSGAAMAVVLGASALGLTQITIMSGLVSRAPGSPGWRSSCLAGCMAREPIRCA